jgi:hypothetical protein
MTKLYDPIGYKFAVEALESEDLHEKERDSFESYKYYCQHGKNPRIDYKLFSKAGKIFHNATRELPVNRYGDANVPLFMKLFNPPFPRSYIDELLAGTLKLKMKGEQDAKEIISFLEGLGYTDEKE